MEWDFPLYVEVLEELAPLLFPLDHVSCVLISVYPHLGHELFASDDQRESWKNICTVFFLSTHNKFSAVRPSS